MPNQVTCNSVPRQIGLGFYVYDVTVTFDYQSNGGSTVLQMPTPPAVLLQSGVSDQMSPVVPPTAGFNETWRKHWDGLFSPPGNATVFFKEVSGPQNISCGC